MPSSLTPSSQSGTRVVSDIVSVEIVDDD
jgi:hypothetical protein